MPERYLIEHCAPTLAAIKTGNLFSISVYSREEAYQEAREINRVLRRRGLRAIPIKRRGNRALIYLYRPAFLKRDLLDPEAAEILRKRGYCPGNTQSCLTQLLQHLANDEDFPHEIGLFLGYPPADVRGFIQSPSRGVQCVGYWKVYENRNRAEETFQRYRQCSLCYRREYERGVTLEQLAVQS